MLAEMARLLGKTVPACASKPETRAQRVRTAGHPERRHATDGGSIGFGARERRKAPGLRHQAYRVPAKSAPKQFSFSTLAPCKSLYLFLHKFIQLVSGSNTKRETCLVAKRYGWCSITKNAPSSGTPNTFICKYIRIFIRALVTFSKCLSRWTDGELTV